MLKTRKAIAEIFSIVGAMASSVRGIYFSKQLAAHGIRQGHLAGPLHVEPF
jgi:hypothetical protein